MKKCDFCGAVIENESTQVCLNCGAQLQGGNLNNMTAEQKHASKVNKYPMKFYYFMIYFALFAEAASSFLSAILYITGGYLGPSASTVYDMFGFAKVVDVIYGLTLIGLGIYAIYIRGRLADFRTDGPKHFYRMCVLSMIQGVLYAIATATMTGSLSMILSNIYYLIIEIIYLACCHSYFKKRKSLFIY